MKYRLLLVWRDEEETQSPMQRAAFDFLTVEEAEAHISAVIAAGRARVHVPGAPLENGAKLMLTFIPVHRIVGWFVWALPDDMQAWQELELCPNA